MPVSDYTPAVNDIGALARTRTVDSNGNETGTFSASTRPTDTNVNSLITDAVGETELVVGSNIPDAPGDTSDPSYDKDALRKAAVRIVALRAAALVELSYFPEQVARGVSPYQQYQDSFEKGLQRLANAVEAARGGEDPGVADGGSQLAQGYFPADGGGLINWSTKF